MLLYKLPLDSYICAFIPFDVVSPLSYLALGSGHSYVWTIWNWQWFISICVRLNLTVMHLLEFINLFNRVITLEGSIFTSLALLTCRENAGLLALTRVGSRRVVQIAAGFMIFFSILGNFCCYVLFSPLVYHNTNVKIIIIQVNSELCLLQFQHLWWQLCTVCSSHMLVRSLLFQQHS